jgi:hypothetical protein
MRAHLVDVKGWIYQGALHVGWSYSSNVHRRETIAGLAQQQIDMLRELVQP